MKIVLFILLLVSPFAQANYDSNFQGKITEILTYGYANQILIKVEGQPTSHEICTLFDFMAIDNDVDPDSRAIMMSRLLYAYATGETINIGYDARDECAAGGRIKIYRAG